MSERKRVSMDRLVEILDERLAEYEVCEGCSFIEPYRLRESADAEPNWSPRGLRGGTISQPCLEAAQTVVDEVAAEYELKAEK